MVNLNGQKTTLSSMNKLSAMPCQKMLEEENNDRMVF
jgi:hypothetical protein